MDTLLLAVDTWDLVLDANGNIALASAPYSLAQDVASAIRTFLGEVWYDDTLGIPFDTQILGHTPPIAVLQAYMVEAALTVPGVVRAKCVIESFNAQTRQVIGQVQFVDDTGGTGAVALSNL
jgi:hypothetical protein